MYYLYYIVNAVCAITEIIYLSLFSNIFFPRRTNRRYVSAGVCLLFSIVLIAISVFPSTVLVRVLFWLIGGIFLIQFFFQAKLLSSVFVNLFFMALCELTDIIVMVFLSLFHIDNTSLMEIGDARILYIIICHIVELIFILGIRLIKGLTANNLSARILLPACPCLIISIFYCCLLASDISGNTEISQANIVVSLGLLYTSILVILYTSRLQEQQNAQHELELANHHYAMQKEYYEQLHAQQEQTHALWHDIKKYLRAIEADSTSDESFGQLQEMVDSISDVVDVNNRIVSVILNEYVQQAKEAETALTLDIQVPNELPMTAADMYILLGNSLDNALDACSDFPASERKIDLQLKLKNQMLFYRISNPFQDTHLQRKRNQFHGYGLKNMQQCVKRNNGTMETTAENGVFTLSALMNFM